MRLNGSYTGAEIRKINKSKPVKYSLYLHDAALDLCHWKRRENQKCGKVTLKANEFQINIINVCTCARI